MKETIYAVMELQSGEAILDTTSLLYSGYKTIEEAEEVIENLMNNYVEEFGLDIEDDDEVNKFDNKEVIIQAREDFVVCLKIIEISCSEKGVNAVSF